MVLLRSRHSGATQLSRQPSAPTSGLFNPPSPTGRNPHHDRPRPRRPRCPVVQFCDLEVEQNAEPAVWNARDHYLSDEHHWVPNEGLDHLDVGVRVFVSAPRIGDGDEQGGSVAAYATSVKRSPKAGQPSW